MTPPEIISQYTNEIKNDYIFYILSLNKERIEMNTEWINDLELPFAVKCQLRTKLLIESDLKSYLEECKELEKRIPNSKTLPVIITGLVEQLTKQHKRL